jgi:hypothetical protein
MDQRCEHESGRELVMVNLRKRGEARRDTEGL